VRAEDGAFAILDAPTADKARPLYWGGESNAPSHS
jgi:hypothetical protein